tara:strand:- start:348 stop:1355 length:1008 start_codon:yes stop_codon:yes gene_type:complete
MTTAKELVQNEDVRIFRAGIWKPRTRPNSFEGVGEKGLKWLKQVKEETGLLVTTEVANAGHVELALKNDIDILWIGARTTVNPFSVQEIADALKGTNIPVMVKNPINVDLALWMGALERLNLAGLDKLVAIHRGFSTSEKTEYRNQPLWRIPIELKRHLPDLPIICDPSHITGDRNRIALVCQKAMDVDMDGVMVETHPNPEQAWSDAAQQVTPTALASIIKSLNLKTEFSPDRTFEQDLGDLRSQIDRIDSEIIESLKMRFNIVERIGDLKMKNSVTALQVQRLDAMMKRIGDKAKKVGLRHEFVEEIYHVVHEESVKLQTEMMRSFLKDKKDS